MNKTNNKKITANTMSNYTKERKMNQLTVAELIAVLQALPNQNALVDMAMNQEYQNAVCAEDVHVWDEGLVIIGE